LRMGGEEEGPTEAIIPAERKTSTVDRSMMRRCLTTLLKPNEVVCRYVRNTRERSLALPPVISSKSHAWYHDTTPSIVGPLWS
jgi:hypothetical protein